MQVDFSIAKEDSGSRFLVFGVDRFFRATCETGGRGLEGAGRLY